MTVVAGTYQRPDGLPDYGWVQFALVPPARLDDGTQVTSSAVRVSLDASGSFTVDLVPDPDLRGVDGTAVYEVTEHVGGLERCWLLAVTDDNPIALPDRYPGTALSPSPVVPVPGDKGDKGDQGDQGDRGRDVWWHGTRAQYDAIPVKDPETLYVVQG